MPVIQKIHSKRTLRVLLSHARRAGAARRAQRHKTPRTMPPIKNQFINGHSQGIVQLVSELISIERSPAIYQKGRKCKRAQLFRI